MEQGGKVGQALGGKVLNICQQLALPHTPASASVVSGRLGQATFLALVLSLRKGGQGKGTDMEPGFLVVECWVKGFLNYLLLMLESPHW